jgi:hypothetical protein
MDQVMMNEKEGMHRIVKIIVAIVFIVTLIIGTAMICDFVYSRPKNIVEKKFGIILPDTIKVIEYIRNS